VRGERGGKSGEYSLERRAVLEIYSMRRCKVIMPKGDTLLQAGARIVDSLEGERQDFLDRPYIYIEGALYYKPKGRGFDSR
jgi:hypothetical protein